MAFLRACAAIILIATVREVASKPVLTTTTSRSIITSFVSDGTTGRTTVYTSRITTTYTRPPGFSSFTTTTKTESFAPAPTRPSTSRPTFPTSSSSAPASTSNAASTTNPSSSGSTILSTPTSGFAGGSIPTNCVADYDRSFSVHLEDALSGFAGAFFLHQSYLRNENNELVYIDKKTSKLGLKGKDNIHGSDLVGPWSICDNSSLSFGGSALFRKCSTGFYRPINQSPAKTNCQQVAFVAQNFGNPPLKTTGESSPSDNSGDSSSGPPMWIAGPIVGGVVLLLALVGGFFWWKRRSQKTTKKPPDVLGTEVKQKAELEDKGIPPPQELSGTKVATELPADTTQYVNELEGDPVTISRASSTSRTQVNELSSHNSRREFQK